MANPRDTIIVDAAWHTGDGVAFTISGSGPQPESRLSTLNEAQAAPALCIFDSRS